MVKKALTLLVFLRIHTDYSGEDRSGLRREPVTGFPVTRQNENIPANTNHSIFIIS
jgi:hypothetical protein